MRCKACDADFRPPRRGQDELCPVCVRAARGQRTEAEIARQIVDDGLYETHWGGRRAYDPNTPGEE